MVLPKKENWSLTSLQQRLVKTGGRLVKHARYYWLLLAESCFLRFRRHVAPCPRGGTMSLDIGSGLRSARSRIQAFAFDSTYQTSMRISSLGAGGVRGRPGIQGGGIGMQRMPSSSSMGKL